MKLQSPILPLFFIQIFLLILADKSIGIPSDQWDLKDSLQNVHTFVQFINDIYTSYDHSGQGYSVEQKRIIFNLTFVKYASEIATFRVLENEIGEGEEVPNLNVINDIYVFFALLHYDQKLGHHIAKTYNKKVFCADKKQIPKEVVNQILQLTFSLAIRIVLSVM
ncbi:hypothetical protein niasHT_029756 [Heterodera trifolii]|uniref:Effector protein n=1 Tax=Heterodera trifolii TaxID=157864 RepID=A0ABD2KRF9_9BILA